MAVFNAKANFFLQNYWDHGAKVANADPAREETICLKSAVGKIIDNLTFARISRICRKIQIILGKKMGLML
jgi:hypothetical protein